MSQPWKLFLDDDRPVPEGWTLARSVAEAQTMVKELGYPVAISLDHDMAWYVPFSTRVREAFRRWGIIRRPKGHRLVERVQGFFVHGVAVEPTGLDFAEWFCHHSIAGARLPDGFVYYIHSANRRGAVMIRDCMFRTLRQEPAGWENWWVK